MTTATIKGWCPGALRPMESGDGLIVRLKIAGGIVPLDLAAKIADWSSRWGNGEIDLTGRANLQLRGVSVETVPALRQAIAEAGLLDAEADGEAVRNVIASPLAGLDPGAVLDIRPIVAKLEGRLASDPKLHALPAKFCFAVDDGGRLGLGDVRADIRFEALATADGPIFAIYYDGGEDRRIGSCNPNDVAEAAALLSSVFLMHRERSGGDIRRVRDLVDTVGMRTLAGAGALGPKSRVARVTPAETFARIGVQSLKDSALPSSGEALGYLGIGLPFGRIAVGDFDRLVKSVGRYDVSEFRLSPWRAIVVPLSSLQSAHDLAGTLAARAFILDPTDPRLRVAACAGAPSCLHGTTPTREDATRLAALIAKGSFLHVSGCAKGCAHPRSAPVTLVGRDGLYDVVHNGAPSESPALRALTLDEAAEHLRQITTKHSQDGIA